MNEIKKLTNKVVQNCKNIKIKNNDINKIKKAIEFADKKHLNQKRKSGEPYIIHPLNTALNLIEWSMDVDCIIAGILHDIIEDTNTTKEEIENLFNKDVADIVETVSKVSNISKKNRSKKIRESIGEREIDYHLKVMMSINSDYRAIIVKLADRLHNMQTINFLPHEKQLKIAQETMDIYANVAGRLGLYKIKTELLDLSFKTLFPTRADIIENNLNTFIDENKQKWDLITNEIENLISKTNINFSTQKRIKGIYSIYKKLSVGKNIDEINDIFANRIIIDGSPEECYKVLGLIHINFLSIPGTFKDYISSPKLNMYQSLHTTIRYENIFIEIQIRTKDMDFEANQGIASHWQYKEKNNSTKNKDVLIRNLMGDLLSRQNYQIDNRKIIKDIFISKVFDVLILNNNKWMIANESLTILDLAFKYNQNEFLMLSSINVNEQKVNFSYTLKPGDIIKFNYSTIIKVKKDWLKNITIDEAKKAVNNYYKNIENDNKELIDKFIKDIQNKLGKNFVGLDELKGKILRNFNIDTLSEFIEICKNEKIEYSDILEICSKSKDNDESLIKIATKINKITPKNILYFKGLEAVSYKSISYPKCCSKIPNVECVAIMEERKKIYIHSHECNKINNGKKRFMLTWDNDKLKKYPRLFNCKISFSCLENILNKVISFISNSNIKIESFISYKNKNDYIRSTNIEMTLELSDIKKVYNLINSLNKSFNLSNIKII